MNDEKAIAAAIHAGLQSDDVTDLYSGDCRGCGECCSRFLPVSPFDRVRLEVYVRRNGIEPAEPRAEYDLLCPYLTDGRECAVYAARPEICRAYRCDRHKRGELGMFFGAECAEVTDMRELAEAMARDVYRKEQGNGQERLRRLLPRVRQVDASRVRALRALPRRLARPLRRVRERAEAAARGRPGGAGHAAPRKEHGERRKVREEGIQMTGNERPDIYADGLREERCENCLHCCATVLRTVHGVERTEYECGRRPEFVHRTQGLARCNYWESR